MSLDNLDIVQYTCDFQPAVCRDYKNYLVIEQKISVSPRCAGLSAGCDTWQRDGGGGDGAVMVGIWNPSIESYGHETAIELETNLHKVWSITIIEGP